MNNIQKRYYVSSYGDLFGHFMTIHTEYVNTFVNNMSAVHQLELLLLLKSRGMNFSVDWRRNFEKDKFYNLEFALDYFLASDFGGKENHCCLSQKLFCFFFKMANTLFMSIFNFASHDFRVKFTIRKLICSA